jgi:hypothetical protein
VDEAQRAVSALTRNRSVVRTRPDPAARPDATVPAAPDELTEKELLVALIARRK